MGTRRLIGHESDHERSELVVCRDERHRVLFCSLHRHTGHDNEVFEYFSKISNHFSKISKGHGNIFEYFTDIYEG